MKIGLFAAGFAAVLAGAPARAHDMVDPPGFLTLSASHTLLKKSEAVTVNVGLFADPSDEDNMKQRTNYKVWFRGQFSKRQWSLPSRFRWTDSEACPEALVVLRKVRAINMPKAMLPIPDPEGIELDDGEIWLEGRIFELSVNSSNLDGELTGEIYMSSNLGTELAQWGTAFLSALEPCWSATVPDNADASAGTRAEAEVNRQPAN
jgi:hypothetical protein